MMTANMYLDRVMEIGAQELDALQKGDAELALELFGQRSLLISQAWNVRGDDTEAYVRRLQEVQRMQDVLSAEARRQRESIRQGLMNSRKEGQRLAGYKKAVSYATASA